MGSAGWWARGGRRAAVVAVGVALVAACNRGRPVLEYDDTVTTVETAEPVSQRGIDQGGAPPPLVRMPEEEGATAIVPREPGKMMPADESAFAPGGSAEGFVPADVPPSVPQAEQAAVGAAASVPANGAQAAVPPAGDPVSATANVESDLELDAEAKAAGKVEIAPTAAEAAKNALPPATGTAVRTTNPWQKAAPWN